MTPDRFVVVPAAYVFLLRDGALSSGSGGPEVLLQLRQNTGFMDDHWAAAAAGHVEKGETAYDAARREAREEIDVGDLALEFVTSMQRTRSGEPIDERVDFFFTTRSVYRTTVTSASGETLYFSGPVLTSVARTVCFRSAVLSSLSFASGRAIR